MKGEQTSLILMEEDLQKDVEGTYCKETTKKLGYHLTEVKKVLDSGLPPDEFDAVSKMRDAIEAASTVIEKVWRGLHH